MAEERMEERTEQATPRKRQEAREKGNVAKSPDLNSAVILLAAVLVLNLSGRTFIGGLMTALQETLGNLHTLDGSLQETLWLFARMGMIMLMTLLPFLVVVFAVAMAISFIQVGFLFTGKPMVPNLEKMNPIKGLGRIFSMRGLMKLVMGLMKLSVVGAVIFITIWLEREEILSLMTRAFETAVGYFAEIIFVVAVRAALALLVLAILDFAYQKWQHEKDLRMSKQEIKEELKRYEGDPKIRERRRAIQRQLAVSRMMTKVPQATVVVTNPTEFSVAIEYDRESMGAPTVVAKGVGHLALRIREIASEHNIPIVQRPEVARALYKTTEVGQTIPYELYQGVAEILPLVYRIKEPAAA